MSWFETSIHTLVSFFPKLISCVHVSVSCVFACVCVCICTLMCRLLVSFYYFYYFCCCGLRELWQSMRCERRCLCVVFETSHRVLCMCITWHAYVSVSVRVRVD